ncbi:MAG: DUF6262 family protein [Eubacteriales bacterium]|nr:DUF6262 family protein [Eubacteriales bacterium]
MNYDKMVSITKEESSKKIKEAKEAITAMLERMEKISVASLVEETGLSPGFFYKNPEVRAELERAKHIQMVEGYELKPKNQKLLDAQNELMNYKLENRMLLQKNQKLEAANIELNKKLESLQKKVSHKELSILKNL